MGRRSGGKGKEKGRGMDIIEDGMEINWVEYRRTKTSTKCN
jgi:hypothetical protein